KFNVVAHTCESHAAQPLNGIIKVDKLVAVFDQDGLHRGFNPGRKNLREIFWMTKVDMLPSPLSGTRRIVDCIFSYTNRNTDFTEKFCVAMRRGRGISVPRHKSDPIL